MKRVFKYPKKDKIIEEDGKKFKILRVGTVKKLGDEFVFKASYPHGFWFNVSKNDIGLKIERDVFYYRRRIDMVK